LGINGAAGTTGASGATGATGASGAAGASGATGSAGASGANGATGTNGTQGATGTNGTPGTQGNQGTAGNSGTTGDSGNTPTTFGAQGASGQAGTNGNPGTSGGDGALLSAVSAYIGSINSNVIVGSYTVQLVSIYVAGSGSDSSYYNGYNPQNPYTGGTTTYAGEGSAFFAWPSGYEWDDSVGYDGLNLVIDTTSAGSGGSGGWILTPWNPQDPGDNYFAYSESQVSPGDWIGDTITGPTGDTANIDWLTDGVGVGFGSYNQVTGTDFYVGINLSFNGSGYTGVYYGWLQFEAGPQYQCGSPCTSFDGTVGDYYPQMFLVAGALAMSPSASIQVGQFWASPVGSNVGPSYPGPAPVPTGPAYN